MRKAELGRAEGEEQEFGRGGEGQAEENHGPEARLAQIFSN